MPCSISGLSSSQVGICQASLGQASFEPDTEVGSVRGTAVTGNSPCSCLYVAHSPQEKITRQWQLGMVKSGIGKPLQSDGGCEGKVRVDQV